MRRALGRRLTGRVEVFPTGIGAQAATEAASEALGAGWGAVRAPRVLIAGLCGALSPAFGVGDVLLYASISAAGEEPVVTDRALTEALVRAIPGAQSGVHAYEASTVLATPAAKREAAARYGAEAGDMESATLARVLTAAGWQVAVLRVVSDGLDDTLPDVATAIDESGSLQAVPLAIASITSPVAAVTMARNAIRALLVLERALRRAFDYAPSTSRADARSAQGDSALRSG